MKKIISIVTLLVVVLLAMPANIAYACECGCDCNKGTTTVATSTVEKTKKTTQLEKKTKALLKPEKSYGKKYGWDCTTKVTKKTSKKLYTRVVFHNDTTRMGLDVTIRATKSKSGKVTAAWWFKDKKDGQWYKTTPEGVERVLKQYGKKVKTKSTPIKDDIPVVP